MRDCLLDNISDACKRENCDACIYEGWCMCIHHQTNRNVQDSMSMLGAAYRRFQ